ncbi:hypothetical protein ACFV6D_02995 [Kitasatospora sp. NPDC059812]|uniref:hypothetical protein n=1 Tax=Kitasatospora sp. NPDC059812 TaxID=3346958 RepID=UPI00365DAE49
MEASRRPSELHKRGSWFSQYAAPAERAEDPVQRLGAGGLDRGEQVEGLHVSLAGAENKLAQINRRRDHRTVVDLGIPTPQLASTASPARP